MERAEILSKVVEIVASKCDVPASELTDEVNFRNDLSLDSIKLVDSIVDVEETFEVEIPDNRLFKINTIGDLVDFLEEEV